MIRSATAIFGALALLAPAATPAAAQGVVPLYACSTQSQLQQIIDSGGDFVPDGCRSLNVSVLETGTERLCVLQLGEGGGVLQQLQDFVSDSELWVRCDLLASELL